MEEVKGKKGKEGTKKEKWNVLEEVVGKRERERERRVHVWRRKKEGGKKKEIRMEKKK